MTKARDIASATTPNANAALLATFPHKNLIINGAMQVAQRGTSETGITSGGSYRNAPDRFKFGLSSAGTWTVSQDSDAPEGFANSYKLACTTADASLSAGDYIDFLTGFEGQDVQRLKKGTASAESVTLSFWCKSNKTGTYIVNIQDTDNARTVAKSYTVNVAGTWEYKTLTFVGDTNGVLDDDNAQSLRVKWFFAAGSTYSSGTLATSWEANTAANYAVGQVNLADSTSNYFNITGVQLEVGDTATPFEHRSFGDELARCQRYFQKVFAGADNRYLAGTSPCIFWNSSNTDNGGITFVKKMRAAPTFSYNALKLRSPYAGNYTIGTLAANAITVDGLTTTTSGSSGSSNERVAYLAGTGTSSYYQIDAEL